MFKDSFDFINKLSQYQLEKDDYLISFDVASLFTYVPIEETLEITKNAFYKRKTYKHLKGSYNFNGDIECMS